MVTEKRRRPKIHRSRPMKISDPQIANHLRLAFSLPEFQAELESGNLMGGFFLTMEELVKYFDRTNGPHYIKKGTPAVAFRIVNCQIDDKDRLIVDFTIEGPRARPMQLAMVHLDNFKGAPIRVVTRSLTARSEHLSDLSVIAVSGFYYVHKGT